MLATALDSHPDIACRREDDQPLYGPVTGRVWTQLENIPDAEKYIVIGRNYRDRMKSFVYSGTSHFYQPSEWPDEPTFAFHGSPGEDQQLEEIGNKLPSLWVYYDQLTGRKDTRVIPEFWAKAMCSFLGVKYHPLYPLTHKPQHVVPTTG